MANHRGSRARLADRHVAHEALFRWQPADLGGSVVGVGVGVSGILDLVGVGVVSILDLDLVGLFVDLVLIFSSAGRARLFVTVSEFYGWMKYPTS